MLIEVVDSVKWPPLVEDASPGAVLPLLETAPLGLDKVRPLIESDSSVSAGLEFR